MSAPSVVERIQQALDQVPPGPDRGARQAALVEQAMRVAIHEGYEAALNDEHEDTRVWAAALRVLEGK